MNFSKGATNSAECCNHRRFIVITNSPSRCFLHSIDRLISSGFWLAARMLAFNCLISEEKYFHLILCERYGNKLELNRFFIWSLFIFTLRKTNSKKAKKFTLNFLNFKSFNRFHMLHFTTATLIVKHDMIICKSAIHNEFRKKIKMKIAVEWNIVRKKLYENIELN